MELDLKDRKEKRYFICNTCSIEVSEEVALLNDFVCSECEEVYQLAINNENILQLEKEILRIKKEIENVSFERKIEEEKLNKKKIKKIKFADAERKAIRKSNRERLKKEREISSKINKKSIESKKSKKTGKGKILPSKKNIKKKKK